VWWLGRHFAWIALAAALVCGCDGSDAVDGGDAPGQVVRTFEDGGVAVTFTLSASRITTAQRVEARLEVLAPEGATVTLPGLDVAVGEFTLVDLARAEPAVAPDGRILHRETYLLEPFLDGTYAVGPMRVSYTPGAGLPARTATIPDEPIGIEVASVLADGEPIPDIKDIAPLAELPPDRRPWIVAGVGVWWLVVLAALATIRHRRRRMQPAPPPEPLADDEIALGELAVLLSENLIAAGRVDEFYTRLTAILRRYIERRFGLHAPVQTTEQFLATIGRDEAFADVHRGLLGRFLARCDLVKFAADRPDDEAIDGAVSTCRQFIPRHDPLREPVDAADTAGTAGVGLASLSRPRQGGGGVLVDRGCGGGRGVVATAADVAGPVSAGVGDCGVGGGAGTPPERDATRANDAQRRCHRDAHGHIERHRDAHGHIEQHDDLDEVRRGDQSP